MTKLGMLDVCGAKYSLKLGETYLIGIKCNDYNQSHDIEVDDTSVDIKHCILDCTEKSAKLIDLRSKCGTFVDGMRVEACKIVALVKSTTIQFGNVEATIELVSESDSGYLEGRLNSPSKDTSEIICNSPEQVSSSESRLKHNLKSSLASTSGATVTSNILIQSSTKTTSDFLVPTGVVRKSLASNTSARSVDSFYIPETQCPMDGNDKTNKSVNVSIDTNKTNNQSIVNPVGTDDEDDFFIPETQDIGSVQVDGLSNYPRLTFQNEDVNEGDVDVVKIPSSQFRISTQDFNGSCDDLSNCSEDMLSTVPCSIIIPPIRHDTVHIDDFLNRNDDELEIEKEMSLLQWSKKTDENADNSVTPDIIDPADGLVTPDIIEGIEPSKGNSKESDTREDIQPTQVWIKPAIEGVELPVSKEETIDNPEQSVCKQVEVISKETDGKEDIPPTQVWIKPASLNNSIAKVSHKENIVPQENDIFLAATQVFKAPLKAKSASPSLLLPPPTLLTPPPSVLQPPVFEDDDLPPTQVFEKVVDKQTNNICLSSTLLDHGMQLAESSFKRNCNKFLDSDDDEMSDTVAPEIENNVEMPPLKTPPNQKTIPSPVSAVKLSNKKDNASSSSTKASKPPPNDEFRVPQSVTKRKTRPEPAVSIDDFLLTPDFLRKGFSKDTHLQQQVEKNWKSIISEKQRTALFGEEDSDGNHLAIDSDSSQDSFDDLLPITVVKDVTEKTLNKVVKSKERESDDGRRVARRRKAMLEEESSEKKVPRKSTTQTNVESDKTLKNDSLKAKKSEKFKKEETAEIAVEKNNKLRDKIKNAEISKKEEKKAEKQPPDENSKKIGLCKQPKPLSGTEDSDKNPLTVDSDTSTDTIDDLLPLEVFKTMNTINKKVKGKAHEADDGIRITRHRKSKLEEEHKEKKVSRKSSSQTKLELKKDPNRVKDDDKKKDEGNIKQVEAKPTKSAAENQDVVVSNKEDNKTKSEAENKFEKFEHEKLPRERLPKQKVKKNSTSEEVSKQKIPNHSKEENREHSHNTSSSSSHNRSNKEKSRDKRQNKSNQKEPGEKSSLIVSDKQEMNTSKGNTASSKDSIKKEIPKKKQDKSQEEKPVARVTRLRSAKTETVTKVEVDKKKYSLRGKGHVETQGVKRSHEQKSIDNDSSNVVTYDLTRESPEPTTKRKNASYEPRNKRLKSTSSMDSLTSIPSSNESHRSIRVRPQKPKIAMTMCEPKYQDLLERYSGTLWFITTDPKECDVMVVEKGNRTYKIMIAIARGIPIVKLDWFKQVVKTKSVQVPYDKYIFDDTNFQERHQFDMKKALSLAKERSLFNGISFLMTPGIRPVPNEMKDIIVCSGGTVHEEIPKPKEGQHIYLVSSPTDKQYWHKYRRTNSNIKIVTSDGVMSSVMRQSETPLEKSIIH